MDRISLRTFVNLAVGLAVAASVAAGQQPAPAKSAPGAKPPSAEAPAPPQPGYSYDPDGRRDPFVSLFGRGSDPRSAASRPVGLAGVLINELSLKGIIKDRNGYFAMIQGPDNKPYTLRAGDRLMDGSVKSVLPDAVVFSQDVNDPLSLIKQREIRKTLRSIQESRG
jgi:Tfp pilus assembly protein PilP